MPTTVLRKPTVITRLATMDQDGGLAHFGKRFLAEGDSWFTIGSLNLAKNSNVLLELMFEQDNAVVSCAYPGHTLQHMVDGYNDPDFDRLLRGGPNFSRFWEGVIVSAGGNDLIDAAQVPPLQADGSAVPAALRLLLTAQEAALRNDGPPALRQVSEAGWATLAGFLAANLRVLHQRKAADQSAASPLFLHTYATPTVRPSGAPGAPQGWLFPSFQAYQIPQAHWQPVADELFGRLRALLLSFDAGSGSPNALPTVHVFDSAGLNNIEPAAAGHPGNSGDWINEIHLNARGYRKLSLQFGKFIDARSG